MFLMMAQRTLAVPVSLLLLALLGVSAGAGAAGRCLKHVSEVTPPRFVLLEGEQTTDLRLEASPKRLTQWLITHVFRIFLMEVLGYDAVTIVETEDTFNSSLAIRRLGEPVGKSRAPRIMANLEVWMRPEENLEWWSEHSTNVLDAGPVSMPGRFAWFVPNALSGGDTSWRIFTALHTARRFSLSEADYAMVSRHSGDETGGPFCREHLCENGRFVPRRCKDKTGKRNKDCAVLFSSYGEMTSFVIEHIETLNLYVEVVWVGPFLGNVTRQLTTKYGDFKVDRSLVLLGWSPSELTVPGDKKYSIVSFPPCEDMKASETVGCKYDLHRLLKLSWNRLKEAAPPAYESIRKVQFDHSDYQDLLNRSRKARPRPNSNEDVACEWLLANENKWREWVWDIDDKREIYIGGIFPITGATYSGKAIVIAARMAREAINKNSSILRDYTLKLLVADGQCRSDVVMKTFIDYIYYDMYPKLVGVLGPACSDSVEPLAGVSKQYHTVVISYSAEGSSFSDRSKYPYFYRTIGENYQYRHVYLQLFQKIGWKQVASLTEDGQRYTEYLLHLQDLLEKHKMKYIANRKFPRNRDSSAMSMYLSELKSKHARIIIGDVNDDAARSLMCAAYHLDMTPKHGYVWFLPQWLSPHWYDTSQFNNSSDPVNCSTHQMIEAINGHFGLTHTSYAADEEMMQENMTVGKWKMKYERECENSGVEVHSYGGFAYDAVWTYALALDTLMRENQSHLVTLHNAQCYDTTHCNNTVKRYVQVLNATDFYGVSGHINFKNGPSRSSVIQVVQWLNNQTHTVGKFFPNSSIPDGGGRLELNKSAIIWMTLDGVTPNDGLEEGLPHCILANLASALNVECEMANVIVNVLVFGILGSIVGVVFYIFKRRYDRKFKITEKYMQSLGIGPDSASKITQITHLDKWEIPREFVVLNRTLGRGAFGTVYGGEANIDNKGWVAVAVKTLKVGSALDEKIDFLSEAEVMKRLDHKNIVKLIGVCTKSEPIYTVMEFMLYGDLKTYLLARRHLVYEKISDESGEVSNKRLTSMALDVARALGYLADLKYVHRDVASRNCLVNVTRVVKLGDFGMTRPLSESDYYKFNRRGMLTVRWMAPESLAVGLFTAASDVWSYGVLLYEIITFGSIPFQGLSNVEVLDFVKNGNTIKIPKGVPSQLEGLIKSCWNSERKKRPQASELVEFLANNPCLLSPCLDAPLSSVQIDDLDETIPERIPNCSVSFNFRKRNVSLSSQPITVEPDLLQDNTQTTSLESNVCPSEPLLGTPKSSSSGMGLSKYVILQHSPSRASTENPYQFNSHDTEVVSIL